MHSLEVYRGQPRYAARGLLVDCQDGLGVWTRIECSDVAEALLLLGGRRRAAAADWILVREIHGPGHRWVYAPDIVRRARREQPTEEPHASTDEFRPSGEFAKGDRDIFLEALKKDGLEVVFHNERNVMMSHAWTLSAASAPSTSDSGSWRTPRHGRQDRQGLKHVASAPAGLHDQGAGDDSVVVQ